MQRRETRPKAHQANLGALSQIRPRRLEIQCPSIESPDVQFTSVGNPPPIFCKMADRFPSIEDIDAGETEVRSGEPSATEGDFLARERAALGEDADLFATSNDQQQTTAASVEDDDDDLLGGGPDDAIPHHQHQASGDLDGFESSFPEISTQNDVREPQLAGTVAQPL